jgi:hypothetical protein
MKSIPNTENSLVLRTDFSDEAAWASLSAAIRKPGGIFRAYVDFVSDSEYEGLTAKQLPSLIPERWNHSFIFIVDRIALQNPEHPVLVVDLYAEVGRTFRVIPFEMWGVENNLPIGNMDFD